MADAGWVKIHRRIVEWDGWKDDAVAKLFIYCVIHANRKRALVNGTWIERGQFVFGSNEAAQDLGWHREKLYRAMRRLEETGSVRFERTNKGTIVTVNAFDFYQLSQNTTANTTTDTTADTTTNTTTDATLTRSTEFIEDKKEASASGFWGDKDEYV